jgi:thioredoxin 2
MVNETSVPGGSSMSHTFAECPKCHSLNRVATKKALEKSAICGKCASPLALHGLVSEITTAGFKKVLSHAPSLVVVDFWASWCGPCKAYGPEYEKASLENQDAIFLKVNTETEQQLSAEYGVRGIPCTILIKDGKEVRRQSGVMSSDQVKQFIG